jgi:hypothetical protein
MVSVSGRYKTAIACRNLENIWEIVIAIARKDNLVATTSENSEIALSVHKYDNLYIQQGIGVYIG